MLETVIRDSGRPELVDFWNHVVHHAGREEPSVDRLVARNLTTDLRLTHPDFAADAAARGAIGDILDALGQWRDACADDMDALHDACARLPHGRLFLLGFPADSVHPDLCGEWVSFVRLWPNADMPWVGADGLRDTYQVEPDIVVEYVRRVCRKKRLLWVCCRREVDPLVGGCLETAAGGRAFDTLRDRLGLDWLPVNALVVGVTVGVQNGEPLARVPSFFDSCGFPYFRPVDGPAFTACGTGVTCRIDDPREPGVPELVVWVADDAAPEHTGILADRDRGDRLALFEGSAAGLEVFRVVAPPDLARYAARRG